MSHTTDQKPKMEDFKLENLSVAGLTVNIGKTTDTPTASDTSVSGPLPSAHQTTSPPRLSSRPRSIPWSSPPVPLSIFSMPTTQSWAIESYRRTLPRAAWPFVAFTFSMGRRTPPTRPAMNALKLSNNVWTSQIATVCAASPSATQATRFSSGTMPFKHTLTWPRHVGFSFKRRVRRADFLWRLFFVTNR